MPGIKKHIKLISKYMWDENQQNSPRRKKKREKYGFIQSYPKATIIKNVMVLDQVTEEQFKATKNQKLATCIHGWSSMKTVFEGPGRGWPMGQYWSESKPPREL